MKPKLESVSILGVNDIDVLNSFPEEERYLLESLTQEQLEEIAIVAEGKLFKFMHDSFWADYSDSIREATIEVLDLDFDEDFNLVKGE